MSKVSIDAARSCNSQPGTQQQPMIAGTCIQHLTQVTTAYHDEVVIRWRGHVLLDYSSIDVPAAHKCRR